MSRPEDVSPLSRDIPVRLAAYAGVVFAYLAAVKNDPLTPVQLGFYAVACAWSLGFERRWRKPFFSQPVKIGLIGIGAVIFVAVVARGVGGNAEHFANSIARFLFWNAIVFVLSRNKSDYDFWTLAIIELSLFMISGSFVQPGAFLPLLVASAACLVYTFLRVGFLRCGAAGEAQRGGWGVAAVTLLFALEIAAAAFVLFPRRVFRGDRPAGAETRKAPPPAGPDVPSIHERTGIPKNPDLLDLRTYHALKSDPRAALRVRVRDLQGRPVSADLTPYLRGAVLDLYQGGEWKAESERRPRRDADDGLRDQWTRLESQVPAGRLVVRQQVHATALAGAVAHLLPDVLRVQLPEVRYDPAVGAVWMPSTPREYVEYFAESALMPVTPPRLTKPPAPALPVHLQLPANLKRVREEAKRLAATLGDLQVDAKVNRFQHYLMHNGFAYKADPFVPAKGVDPVEHFLEKREGFCIHYASALVLLCRAAGIPARVATGFQLHDPEEDGSFLVRLADAHAWAEVWFGAEHGWRAYDATPSEGRTPAPPEGAPVASLDLKKPDPGAPGGRWDRLILEFDPESQGETLRGSLKAVGSFLLAALAFLVSPWALGLLVALGAAAVAVWLCLPGTQKRRLRQIAAGFKDTATVDFYRDFLWALARRGLRKAPSLTPLEFARQAKASVADEGIDFITEKFYEARYAGRPPSPEDRRLIDAALERLLAGVNVPIRFER